MMPTERAPLVTRRWATAACALLLLLWTTVACGTPSTPVSPSQSPSISEAPAPPLSGTVKIVRVIDGWTNRPVAGARIVSNGPAAVTGPDGQIEMPVACAPATITADGFLERSVLCLDGAIGGGTAPLDLWPAGTETERSATRDTVFPNDGWLTRVIATAFLSDALGEEAQRVWRRAAADLAPLSPPNAPIHVVESPYTADFSVRLAGIQETCGQGARWDIDVAGYCLLVSAAGEVQGVAVKRALAADSGVAVRALLNAAGMQPHRMGGVLNLDQPAQNLSEFERKTLRMVGRRAGIRTVWPDRQIPW
jgi:hypothetical protein